MRCAGSSLFMVFDMAAVSLSSRIRIQEKSNYELAEKKFSSIKEQVQKVRVSQRAVTKYYQSMGRRLDQYDPQFLDNNG